MAKKDRYGLTLNLTEAEINNFLQANNLFPLFVTLSQNPKIKSVYDGLVEMENTEYPQTMQVYIKTAQKPIFKDFDEFQNIFFNYLKRSLIIAYLYERFRKPNKSSEKVVESIFEKGNSILERALSIAFSEFSTDIQISLINKGLQPFDFI